MTNMATPLSALDISVLMFDAGELVADPVFQRRLQSLVDAYKKEIKEKNIRKEFAEKLLSQPASDKRVQALLALFSRKCLSYSEREWVPSEYESLERMGLVKCRYGSKDQHGLSSRHLDLTGAGEELAIRLQSQASA